MLADSHARDLKVLVAMLNAAHKASRITSYAVHALRV
jgi:hypothetical protein